MIQFETRFGVCSSLRLPRLAGVGLTCVGLAVCGGLSGCESAGWNARLKEAFAGGPSISNTAEEQHRAAYVSERSRDDLYWLLANRVETGMTVHEVSGILGEEGIREKSGQWVRQGEFRVDDQVYKFGPDNSGQSVYLIFREGKLVNHSPDDFRLASTGKRSKA